MDNNQWIAVDDRLPTRDGRYLVHCPSADPDSPLITVAWYHPEEGAWSLLPEPWVRAIRHWMVVPGPPSPTPCPRPHVPNPATISAIQAAEAGELTGYAIVEDMMKAVREKTGLTWEEYNG